MAYDSMVSNIVRRGCAKIGGASDFMTYVVISATGAASGNGGGVAADAAGVCDQQLDPTGLCDILTRKVILRSSGHVEPTR